MKLTALFVFLCFVAVSARMLGEKACTQWVCVYLESSALYSVFVRVLLVRQTVNAVMV